MATDRRDDSYLAFHPREDHRDYEDPYAILGALLVAAGVTIGFLLWDLCDNTTGLVFLCLCWVEFQWWYGGRPTAMRWQFDPVWTARRRELRAQGVPAFIVAVELDPRAPVGAAGVGRWDDVGLLSVDGQSVRFEGYCFDLALSRSQIESVTWRDAQGWACTGYCMKFLAPVGERTAVCFYLAEGRSTRETGRINEALRQALTPFWKEGSTRS